MIDNWALIKILQQKKAFHFNPELLSSTSVYFHFTEMKQSKGSNNIMVTVFGEKWTVIGFQNNFSQELHELTFACQLTCLKWYSSGSDSFSKSPACSHLVKWIYCLSKHDLFPFLHNFREIMTWWCFIVNCVSDSETQGLCLSVQWQAFPHRSSRKRNHLSGWWLTHNVHMSVWRKLFAQGKS